MIQESVRISLEGLLGWRDTTVSGMPTIDADNKLTSSGLYYQDFSSLLTVQNVYSCQENLSVTDAQFNTLLSNLKRSAILKVLNAVFSKPDFIENKVLYPYENVFTDLLENGQNFVGYEFYVPKRKDLIVRINRVMTTFDSADTVKLLLFHSSRKAAIDSKELSVQELTESDTDLKWDLSQFKYSGGKFYVGYLQNGLTAKAVNREWDQSNIRSCFNTFRIRPIIISGHNVETLFDVDEVEYEDDTYGLNFDITVWKDYSNVVEQNMYKFTNAIGYQVAADILDLILKAVRSNRIERLTESQVLFELEGLIGPDLPRSVGILKKLSNEISDLSKNFQREQTLKIGTIG